MAMKPIKIFNLQINKAEIIGVTISLIIVILNFIFIFKNKPLFYFILGISFIIAGIPFFLFLIFETNKMMEKELMFLEFSRGLVESVRAGTPISKSVLNIRTKDYGALNPHVQKLANQISLGIPLQTAFETFSKDIKSEVITRAITIMSESEKAGGNIEDVLDSVVKSVSQIENLKKERRAVIYTFVVQGYIIFLIFMVIILVMEFKILPIASGLGEGINSGIGENIGAGFGSALGAGGKIASPKELSRPFFWFLIIQGFFTGLVIGKMSEGKIFLGLKHSFILMVLAILVNTGSKLFLGVPGG
ncbi:MAG: type II secretion system F family protein [Nanoarchaeota archaeon]